MFPFFFTSANRNPFRFQITPSVTTPVDHYFDLSLAPAAFWAHVRSDGGDIRVLKQDGLTPVAREVSAFDAGTGVGSLWIKGDSATSFWVTYGNAAWAEPAAGSTYGRHATWESALKLVLHGQDFNDSTVNANNASHSAGVSAAAAGKIRGAFVSTVSSDYISIAHNDSLVFSNLSVATWINWTSSPGGTGRIVNKANSNSGLKWFVSSDGSLTLSGYNIGISTSPAVVPSGSWHHIAFSLDSLGNSVQYIDGVSVKTGTTEAPSGIPAAALKFFNRDDNTRTLIGSLDEARVCNRIVSGTEWANIYAEQNSPVTFWTVGSEQQA